MQNMALGNFIFYAVLYIGLLRVGFYNQASFVELIIINYF